LADFDIFGTQHRENTLRKITVVPATSS